MFHQYLSTLLVILASLSFLFLFGVFMWIVSRMTGEPDGTLHIVWESEEQHKRYLEKWTKGHSRHTA